jgi:lysozyme
MTRTQKRYTAVFTALAGSLLALAGFTTAANAATGSAVIPSASATFGMSALHAAAPAVRPQEISAVCEYAAGEPELYEGVSGQAIAIKQAQCELNYTYASHSSVNYGNGAYNGLTVDGSFGPETKAAVEGFQAYEEISVDGVIGPNTWGELDACVQSGIEVGGWC